MRTNTQITLLTRGITPRIDRPQYEDGTELGLMVMDTDISGYSAQIYEKKSDDTVVYNSCAIEDNTIVVTLDNQMTASEGENKFTIRLTKSGHETFAFPLILNIIGVPFSGEESHSESSILQQFIDEAEGYADDAHNSAVDADASKNAAKAYYDNLASFGTKNHSIMDSNGSPMPARDTLQFANSRVTDDSANDKTIVAPAHVHTNLLNPILETKTASGLTVTNNGDGTYTLTGVDSGNGQNFIFRTNMDLEDGQYKWVCESTDSGYAHVDSDIVRIAKDGGARAVVGSDQGNGLTFSADSSAYRYECRIHIHPNASITSLTFKPMLTTDLSATYDDFVAYSGDGELNENVASLYEGLESTDANLSDVQSQIVTSGNIESGNTATSAHTVGTYIQWKGKFYTVTAAIAVGDTLAVGTNLAAKTVGEVLAQINTDLSNKLGKTETAENATKWSGITYDVGTNNTTDTWVPVLNANKMQHRVIPTTYNTTNPTLDGLTVNADALFNNGQVTVNRTDNLYYWHFLAMRGDKRLFHTQYNDFNGGYNFNNRHGYELVSESGDMIFSAYETSLFHFNGSGRYTGSWAQSSSRRYKKNIEPITDKDALKILDLNPVEFDFNDSGIHSHGLIAEEVSEIMPNLVIYNKEEQPDAIDYSQFVPYLLKLCQMQQLQIDELKEKIDELIEKSNKQ